MHWLSLNHTAYLSAPSTTIILPQFVPPAPGVASGCAPIISMCDRALSCFCSGLFDSALGYLTANKVRGLGRFRLRSVEYHTSGSASGYPSRRLRRSCGAQPALKKGLYEGGAVMCKPGHPPPTPEKCSS